VARLPLWLGSVSPTLGTDRLRTARRFGNGRARFRPAAMRRGRPPGQDGRGPDSWTSLSAGTRVPDVTSL